jgi:hypothetical protein
VGVHTLFLFAGYGTEGGTVSTANGSGYTPEISNLVAVPFVVLPIPTETAVVANANPQNQGSGVTFTATVTPNFTGASSPSGTVSFFDGSTLLGSGALTNAAAAFTTSSLTAGSHSLTGIYSGDTLYASSSGPLTEQIKVTSTVSAWPTASAITDGQTLAASTLTGGTSTPAGSFAWTTPSTVPAAGTASYSVTFTPTDSADYSTATGAVSVTVNQVTSTNTVTFVTDGTTGATLTGSTSQTLTSGASTTPVTANAPTGYVFLDWTGTSGFTTTTANPLTVTNITAAEAITAHFSKNAVLITVPPPSTLVVPSGGSCTTSFTLSAQGSLTKLISLTATGLPPGATCTFSSPSVDVSGGPVTVTATITTARGVTLTGQNKGYNPLGGIGAGAGAVLVCGFLARPGTRRRKRLGLFLSALLVLMVGGLTACSSTSNSKGMTSSPAVTPAGTYTVTLTATATGAAPASTTFQLTVQ